MKLSGPYLIIRATLMLDAIGIGIVFPIMPDLMDRVGAGDTAEGAFWGGILLAAYAGAMSLFAPVIGSLSDAFGRKPILLAALTFLALDYVVMALADTFWLLLLGRTLAGIAGSTYTTATAYISDIAKPEERGPAFGMIGAAFGIGFVMGPAIGGLASGISLSAPFWIAAGLAALNVLFGLFILPESLPPEKRRPFGRRDMNPFGSILDAFRVPGLAIPLICLFVFEFANMVYPVLWAFWTREVFGWDGKIIGLTLAAYGVLIAGVQAGLLPQLTRRFGEFRTLGIGLAASVIAFFGFGLTGSILAFCIFLPIAALSDMAPPLMTALAANVADEDRQGLVQGVIASLSSIAAIVAPLIVTGVFRRFVSADAAIYLPGAPFILAGVMILCVLPLIARLRRSGQV